MRVSSVLIYIILLFFFASCDRSTSLLINKLDEAEKIEGKIISKSNQVLSEPLRMVYSAPSLIYSTKNHYKMIECLNVYSGMVTNKVFNQGNGPNELMSVSSLQNNIENDIFVYDNIKKKIFNTLNDSCSLIKEATFKDNVYQAFCIKKNLFVTNGFFNDGRFKLFNNDTTLFIYKELICYETNVNDTSFINIGYLNFSSISSDRKKFANIIFNTEVIESFSIENDSIKKIWSFKGSLYPVTELTIGKGTMAVQSDEYFGFKNLSVTDRYIYATYSKENIKKSKPNTAYANYLFVFTWNGEIHDIYLLDYLVRTIAVSPDDRFFFATTIIDNDVKIVEYEL